MMKGDMNKYEGHTPGPWSREFTESNRSIIVGQPEDGSAEVCEVNGQWVGMIAHNANAKLIADAPMLAEQNAEMLAMLEEVESDWYDPDGVGWEVILKIKALIAEIEEGV